MYTMLWLWKMAWRDSRGSRQRLLLTMAAISVGIAACVAMTAFEANLRVAVANQSRALLGADLVLSSRQPLSPAAELFIATLGGEQSRELSCTSMAYFPHTSASRLVQVRALEGNFPYYGSLETVPASASQTFRTTLQAVVDDGLLQQFAAQVGDSIQIGAMTLPIAGRLTRIPGESLATALISPRVYIPMAALQQAELLQKGSMVTYQVYIKLPPGVDADALIETQQDQLSTHRLRADTARRRAASIGRTLANLSHFLNLVGFIAMLLGGVGVASAMQVYMQEKHNTVAVLRCLGASAPQAMAVYVLQAALLGTLSALCGGAGGLLVQRYLPRLLSDFLPLAIPVTIAWPAVLLVLAGSFVLVLLFALLALVAVRTVPPLAALRLDYAGPQAGWRDPWRWSVVLGLLGSVTAFALMHSERWTYGLGFCLGLGVAAALLTGVARLLILLARVALPAAWPYVWRQGLMNLYRPRNQTLLMVLALGLGTFVLMTLYLTQRSLLHQVTLAEAAGQPNMLLFDIQSDQHQAVTALAHSYGLSVLQQVPLVSMRLVSVKDKSIAALRAEDGGRQQERALLWEYRATYREHLLDTEMLSAGTWQGQVEPDAGTVPISLEADLASTLDVQLGDTLVFDLQGVPISTTVASLRRVDWQRLQPNVFVLFPTGVLEAAPQFHVFLLRLPGPEPAALLQRAVVQQFPNVSVIDLRLVLQTLEAVLQRLALVLRFMALFSLAAGMMVLTAAVLTGRYQRLRESVLLRTLGASRRQIRQILLLEYLFLGGFAALTGLLLALLASWLLAAFLFETAVVPVGWSLLSAFVLVLTLTVLTGLLGSRGVTRRPPLEVLRSEM